MKEKLTHREKLELAGVRKFGSKEAWLESTRKTGSVGGSARVPKGFAIMKATNPKKFKELSSKGGKRATEQPTTES